MDEVHRTRSIIVGRDRPRRHWPFTAVCHMLKR
jgi:hypothetical protein